jgi:hypothetical protein
MHSSHSAYKRNFIKLHFRKETFQRAFDQRGREGDLIEFRKKLFRNIII